MKKLQQNLFVVIAASLCGLCVYQWYGQTLQRTGIHRLEQMVYDKSLAIQGCTNSIRAMDQQIAMMDAKLTELKGENKTNADVIISQRRDLNRFRVTTEDLTNEVSSYKAALANFQGKLKEAYAGIEKQNAAMKELAAQRDEFIRKFNESVKDRNEIVGKYNDLVSQVERKQATNAAQ
jgi:chromosome segregation ATPase